MTHAIGSSARSAPRIAGWAGLVTCAAAGAALAGWVFDVELLKSVAPGRPAIRPLSAVALLLVGLAITLRARTADDDARREIGVTITRAIGFAVVAIATATILEYLAGVDLGIDTWMFRDKLSRSSPVYSGRMAHAAAVALLYLGAAILFDTFERATSTVAQLLALLAASVGLLGVSGYLYDIHALAGFSGYASVSLPTAVLLLVAAGGVLLLQPQKGVIVEILSRHSGGVMARRLLPAAVLVPFVFGWLESAGERLGLYSQVFGQAVLAAMNVIAFVTLIWLGARLLNRLDRHREAADLIARAALGESERHYRTLAESLPQLVWTCTGDGLCDYQSPQWAAYTGLSASDHRGRPWADPVHPDDAVSALAQWKRCSQSGTRFDAEFRIVAAEGSYRWFRTLATPLRGEDGQILKWFATSSDIEDRKRAETELQAMAAALEQRVEERTRELQAAKERAESADRLKTDFIMSMSHELRTPLNTIIGFSATLLMRMPGPLTPEQGHHLRLVQSSGRHLLTIISDVLDVARIESGKYEIGCESVDVASVVLEVVAELQPLAYEKQLSLQCTVPPLPLRMTSDRRALKQILINLTANAIKFTDRGGVTLTLEEARRNDRDVIDASVIDTGIGIAPADLPKLFAKFSQLSKSGTTSSGGTGLGLYLSQTLAERLGGKIAVDSEPGRGSCFVLTLPIEHNA
jgi:PAS domain S-box-containing protein